MRFVFSLLSLFIWIVFYFYVGSASKDMGEAFFVRKIGFKQLQFLFVCSFFPRLFYSIFD